MSEEVAELIRALDTPTGDDAEEARASLRSMGAVAVAALLKALPELGFFGKLTAIEVCEESGDQTSGPSLIGLLSSEFDVVRERSATALRVLGITAAIPALELAYEVTKRNAIPPDWTEPAAMRHALAALGARKPVVPALTRNLARKISHATVWPSARLRDVLEDLSAAGQVCAYFQIWTENADGHLYWVSDAPRYNLDWTLRWPDLLTQARELSIAAADRVVAAPNVVATIEWLGQGDV